MDSTLSSYTMKDLQQHRELATKLLDYHESNLKRCPPTEAELYFSLERAIHYAKEELDTIDKEIATRTKNESKEASTPSSTSHADNSQ